MRYVFRSDRVGIDHIPTLIESLPIPFVISQLHDHRIVAVNEAACEFLGRTRDELVELSIDDITAPTDHREVATHLGRLSREQLVVEKRYLRGDGTLVHGRVHAVAMPVDEGLAAAVIVDTSDFRESLRRLDTLVTGAELVAGTGRDPNTFVQQIAELLRRDLGVELSVQWDAAPRQGAADQPSNRTRVYPISALGDSIGTATLRPADGDHQAIEDDRLGWVVAKLLGTASVVSQLSSALRAAQLFEVGFETSDVGLQLVEPSGTYLRVNEAFAAMVGRSAEELVGLNWRDVTAEPDARAQSSIEHALATGATARHQEIKRYVRRDGSVVWANMSVTPVFMEGPDQPDERVHLTQVIDVTAQINALERERVAREALEASERRYRSLVEPAPDAVLRVAVDGTITDGNRQAVAMLGLMSSEQLAGRRLAALMPSATAGAILERVREVASSGEPAEVWRSWLEPADQPPGWYLFRTVPEFTDGDAVEIVYVVASEITELVENEQRLASLALVDPLTGVSNRAAIFDRLQQALDRLRRQPESGVVVAMCDLDHFKSINDTYGHLYGDEALRAVATQLQSCVRAHDTVGRLGGDEFVVLFDDVTDPARVEQLGERTSDAISRAFVDLPGGHRVQMSGSVGTAWTTKPVELTDLLARADRAMYEAKRRGRGQSWSESSEDRGGADSQPAFLRDLEAAIDRDQFEVHYQPIVDTAARDVVAVEALLRWNHPDGMREPAQFLSHLLETGQMGLVGQWVLRTAIRQLAKWRTQDALCDLSLHVNVTAGELATPYFTSGLHDVLAGTGVDPDAVHIEVTEQALSGTVVPSAALDDIAGHGVRIVLDDFGAGVSSLSHLRTRSLHGVTIDRSLIAGSEDRPADRQVTAAIVQLAQSLGLDVIAEGVETPEQAAWLDALGCHRHQGWLYSTAVPPDEIEQLVHELRTLPPSAG